MPNDSEFFDLFQRGAFDAAKAWLQEHRIAPGDGLQAHPLLRAAVESNGGHCFKRPQLAIADLLIPKFVQGFRNSVVDNKPREVARKLEKKPALLHAEFTAGRGIAQAIHHWKSTQMGRLLIDSGADLEAQTSVNGGGETPLVMQLRFGSIDGVRLLLEKKADPNQGGLKFMPGKKMSERVELLLAHGWNIDEGAGERTLMHHDAAHGTGAKIRVLLEHGADPNARDAQNRTALHWLAERGVGEETLRALAKAGADLTAVDSEGRTALDLARTNGNESTLRTLEELGASPG